MYKLSMVVIYYDSPDYTEGDNQSEIYNRTVPDSTLDKKNQSIAYNFVMELSAYDEWRTTYVKTHKNELDILTKQLSTGDKRKVFVGNLFHHVFSSH